MTVTTHSNVYLQQCDITVFSTLDQESKPEKTSRCLTRQAMPDSSPDMFRPPVNRAMRTLDRAFFRRRYPISAARVADLKSISRVSKALLQSKDAIIMRMVHPVRTDPVDTTAKCVLLRSEIRPDGNS